MAITASLVSHVRKNQLGSVYAAETGFLIQRNPDTARAPDVAFISRKRLQAVGEIEGYWPGAPDLVIEVISPGDTKTQVERLVSVLSLSQFVERLVSVLSLSQFVMSNDGGIDSVRPFGQPPRFLRNAHALGGHDCPVDISAKKVGSSFSDPTLSYASCF